MTQTSELAAGREMDALVAEKVMGWTHDSPNSIWWHRPPMQHESGPRMIEVPAFSTDIAQAWNVFEMALIQVGTASIHADMEDWGRGAFTGNGAERVVTVTIGDWSVTDVAPLAICRAALAAIGA